MKSLQCPILKALSDQLDIHVFVSLNCCGFSGKMTCVFLFLSNGEKAELKQFFLQLEIGVSIFA